MESTGMASPWVVYAREVEALLGGDPEVAVAFDNEEPKLTLYVANRSKADALALLLGESREFGGVSLAVEVVPANEDEGEGELLRRALAGNPAFVDVIEADGPMALQASYVVMAPEAAQYASDSLQSPYGMATKVYEDVARDVFDVHPGTFFCSDLKR